MHLHSLFMHAKIMRISNSVDGSTQSGRKKRDRKGLDVIVIASFEGDRELLTQNA